MEIENHDSHIPSPSTTAKLTKNPKTKEPSKARLIATLQAHPSIGKDWMQRRLDAPAVAVPQLLYPEARKLSGSFIEKKPLSGQPETATWTVELL